MKSCASSVGLQRWQSPEEDSMRQLYGVLYIQNETEWAQESDGFVRDTIAEWQGLRFLSANFSRGSRNIILRKWWLFRRNRIICLQNVAVMENLPGKIELISPVHEPSDFKPDSRRSMHTQIHTYLGISLEILIYGCSKCAKMKCI